MLAVLLAAALVQSPLPGDPLETSIHTLPNGLTIYLSPNKQEPRIATRIAVRAGSKHDPADSTGMAHYLEHMLFKGSQSLGTLDYSKERPHLDRISRLYEELFAARDPKERERVYAEIDAENVKASRYAVPNEIAKAYRLLGVRGLNAYTSDEMTVYVSNIPSNRAEAWAKLEADRFARPVFRLFQTELETVYEEKNRSLDNAERIIAEALDAKLFKRHPYGQQPTIGTIAHLKNPSLRKMYEFYGRWYHPNNMAIVLAGDFEREPMLRLLERHFGAWKPKTLPAPPQWPIPPPKGTERVEVKYEAEEKAVIAWLTVPHSHPDAEALIVLDMLMDNSAAGLINLHLNQAQRVKNAGSYPAQYNDAGAWYLWAVPKQGQTLEEAETLLLETVDRLKNGEFTDADISAIITNFEISKKAQLESNEARAGEMTDSFLRFEPWPETVARLDRLRKVTKADVVAAAKKYLGADKVVAYRRNAKPELPSITKPKFTKIDIDPARQSSFFNLVVNTPAEPIEPRWLVEGRDYSITDLPEGRLYATPNPFNDLFSITWRFDVGWRRQRELCAASSLFDLAGAGSLTADDLKKKLYSLGTSLSIGCGEQSVNVTLAGLEKHLWESLELMRRRFEEPNLSTDTLKKMVDVAIGAHQDNKRDPGYVHYALGEWAERGADSAVLGELTDAELRALEEKRLTGLLRGLWGYKRKIAYVGIRPPGELARLISSVNGDRTRFAEPPAYRPLRYLKPRRPRLLFTHRDMVQSRVGLTAADEVLDPAKALDYQMFSSYMGGGMSAVIFQEIREARSLAYSAGGGYAPGSVKGDENQVYGTLGCQADKTVEAAKLLTQLFREPPLTDRRFLETRQALEQSYRANPIHFRGAPGAVISWEEQGIAGGDPRPRRFERLLTYSLSDLEAFARRMKDKVFTLYVLSHRDRVGLEELKGLGDFEEKTLDELFPY